ncbi:hypothetical protein CYY_002200 [Polysphondylium violaceum]|uniref:FMN hydroxy acid dehydrogenase domain-containing protein n=1 Tax=Polysphondylium violaceum TaxID=133409 RepID=A0A8J4Q0M1_9MYCE|nr:hypothetical protein CYY_002200 [Polysphondylium violaceum]
MSNNTITYDDIKSSDQFRNNKVDAMSQFVNINEFKIEAQKKLPKMAYDYYASGANDQITLADNENSFKRIKLIPRCLVDVSNVNIKTSIFGVDIKTPIMIAPAAMQKMASHLGELDTLAAAHEMGTIMTLSSLSTSSVEELSEQSKGNPGWFQLYVFKDRKISEDLVKRAERLGYTAIVLTVDTPYLGKRDADYKNKFHLPLNLQLKIFSHLPLSKLDGGLNNYMATMIDPALTWKDVQWLKSITKLPVLVKGIMCPEDAELSIKHGADGIIVSNHGARQLDTCPSTIDVLYPISKAVRGRVPVILDGGVRRGSDVLKALALGANTVMIGRPILWGLSVGGQAGVSRVIKLLNDELLLAMAFTGLNSVKEISPAIIYKHPLSKF